ncbi:hypothetical protein BIW11_10956 [Tropilaelaps mercedesae]|uniref:Secreted protein n=1 Tax=Tropilaelaps mercedesae TaxID=418985 RepID=A0A1V9XD78_9ACAR|nr:hypothetical protein BIW11_10956 [Tropilaelaps mercedesae]
MCRLLRIAWLITITRLVQQLCLPDVMAQPLQPDEFQALHALRLARLMSMPFPTSVQSNHETAPRRTAIYLDTSTLKSRRVRPSSANSGFAFKPSPNLPNGLDVPPPVRRRW